MDFKLYCFDGRVTDYNDFSIGSRLITEINKEPEIGENLEINNKLYSVSIISPKNKQVVIREIFFKEDDEVKETLEETFTCPYCDYEYVDAFELSDQGKIKCPHCRSELEYERIITIEYSVIPIKKAKIRKV